MIDWKKPWLKENLEEARRDYESRPAWMKEAGRDFLKSVEERAKLAISEPEGDENLYWE